MRGGGSGLEVRGIHVARDGRPVLHGVDVHVPGGDVVALLGPSGSGKTTLLRAIAGLDGLAAGRIVLDGRDLTHRSPGARGVTMVFQGAALYPWADVEANLALPLRFHGTPEDEIERRVGAEARAFALQDLLDRLPRQISTGERQAAATARSLTRTPELLLLDEPFDGLDERTRTAAMHQLATVQQGYGVTTLLASNDQRSAAALSSAVVVLDAGRIAQSGPWAELLAHPASTAVAAFLGEPPMNLLAVDIEPEGGRVALVHGRFRHTTADRRVTPAVATMGVRPEHLTVVGPAAADVVGSVALVELLGPDGLVRVDIGGSAQLVTRLPRPLPRRGDAIALRATRLHLFDATGQAVGELA